MKKQRYTYSFLDEYNQHISPAIGAIDVFLRTAKYPLSITDVACVLDIDSAEVTDIATGINCDAIDKAAFIAIMARGSSRICRMYGREAACGSPPTYSAAQIAYIYNLDIGLVENACDALGIREVTTLTMPLVFSLIPY